MGTIKQRRIEKRLLVLEDGSAISSLHRRYFYITSTPFRRSKSVEIPLKERSNNEPSANLRRRCNWCSDCKTNNGSGRADRGERDDNWGRKCKKIESLLNFLYLCRNKKLWLMDTTSCYIVRYNKNLTIYTNQ